MQDSALYAVFGLPFLASPLVLAGFIVFQWVKGGPTRRRVVSVLLLYVLLVLLFSLYLLPVTALGSEVLTATAIVEGLGVLLGVVVGGVFSVVRGIIRWHKRLRADEGEPRLAEGRQSQLTETTDQVRSQVRNEEGVHPFHRMRQGVRNVELALGAQVHLARATWHRERLSAQERRLAEEQRLVEERRLAEERRQAEEQERQRQEKIRLSEEAERRRRVIETLGRAKARSLLRRRDEEEQRKHIESVLRADSVMDNHGIRKGKTIEVSWDGPYSWPGFERENNLRPLPKLPGVYLQTFKYRGGYLIYAAGLTRRPAPMRFKRHTSNFKKGEYTVLDITAAQEGVRREIYHGWARKDLEDFEVRKLEILDAVRKQLAGFRIFITHTIDLRKEERVLERLEAAIMYNLYQQPSPIRDIPDRGMHLRRRRDSDNPIIVRNHCAALLYGLPAILEI